MTFYSEMAAVADELLTEFGAAVTLRVITSGAYNPATGGVTRTTTEHNGVGAAFDFGLHMSGQSFQPGTMIESGDKQLLLSPAGIPAPGPGDQIALAGGAVWTIKAVKETAPAGTPVLYECLLRR